MATEAGQEKGRQTRKLAPTQRAQRRVELALLCYEFGAAEAARLTGMSRVWLDEIRRGAGLGAGAAGRRSRGKVLNLHAMLRHAEEATGWKDLEARSGYPQHVCHKAITALGRQDEFRIRFCQNQYQARRAALLQDLRDLRRTLGRPPGLNDVRRGGRYGVDSYYRYFNNFPAAREEALG